jgi:glucosamine-6-phosphate deaminase
MEVIIRENPEIGCVLGAKIIARVVREKPDAVLGLATGRTPLRLYQELIRLHRDEGLDFSRVTTFNLDEYVGLAATHDQSYRYFMRENLFRHINLDPTRTHVPDGTAPDLHAECRGYEQRILDAGGIDIQLLGLGRNGHIGFNEPGSARDSRTRVVELDATTRGDAVAGFGSLDLVPRQAITAGVATILASRRIVLLAFGRSKAAIVRRMLRGPVGPECPASWLQAVGHALVVLDHEAAAEL